MARNRGHLCALHFYTTYTSRGNTPTMDFLTSLSEPDKRDNLALVTENHQFTFGELEKITNRCAKLMLRASTDPNERVVLCFRNQAMHLVASIAAIKAQLCQISIQPGIPAKKAEQLFSDTEARLVFSDGRNFENQKLTTIQLDELRFEESTEEAGTRFECDSPALACILAGSGTTGEPKLLGVSFENLNVLIKRDCLARPMSVGDFHLSYTPTEFYTAKRRSFAYLQQGACIVVRENEKYPISQLVRKHKIQHFSLAISHAIGIARLYSRSPAEQKSLFQYSKSMFIGGSPVSERYRELLNEISNNSLVIAYGTNEMGECCTANFEMQQDYPGSVGKPLPGVEIEEVPLDNAGDSNQKAGSLRIRTDARATQIGINNDPPDAADWFYPGDLAQIQDGVVIFKGRNDDAISFHGVLIYPREIELVLETHPAVQEVAAFGIDVEEGQIPAVVFTASERLEPKSISKLLQETLGWLTPRVIYQASALPKNEAGKIMKRNIKAAVIKELQSRK